jgi:tetratricopeptide (TPR) repeat protein
MTQTMERRLVIALGLAVLIYAFVAGLRTVTDFDLGWQLATGRWVAQHHQVPSVDVFSYTAQGKPWIYPVGSGLIFYATYRLGGYALLSWLGAAACAGTVAILLRRGSAASAVLAIFAMPLIAARTAPRADMFTVVLFAAVLSLLWQQHETGRAWLWQLPLLMVAWVNLHLGFVAGLALLCVYAMLEALEMLWPERRQAAQERLRRSLPWLLASAAATLVNPWGWGIYRALFRQQAAMAAHAEAITEWGASRLNWTVLTASLSLRSPDPFVVLLLVAAVAVPVALWRRQLGAAALMTGAAIIAFRHLRFQALFGVVMVIVAGVVLSSALGVLWSKIEDARLKTIIALGATCFLLGLSAVRSVDLASNRAYLASSASASFGPGLSWWFPERAADFIERESIPGQIFNTYNEGGYFTWRLGPKYLDYIDGRAIPFGTELFDRNGTLLGTPPNSPEWQEEAKRYNLNTILVPLGRHWALQYFTVLQQFCASDIWRPVYLDEVSAVFVRRTPETEGLVQRLHINCNTASVPAVPPQTGGGNAFNQWANAAAVLQALGRNSEAFDATTQALNIFPDNAFVHFVRGNLLEEAGRLRDAEEQYLLAARLGNNGANWSKLAALYHREGRLLPEIDAWEHSVDLMPDPGLTLLSLGYADLKANRPRQALQAFDRAMSSQPAQTATADSSFMANLAHGRALAWTALGDVKRAVSCEEETVRLAPDRYDDWLYLASLYERQRRTREAQAARERAAAIRAQ